MLCVGRARLLADLGKALHWGGRPGRPPPVPVRLSLEPVGHDLSRRRSRRHGERVRRARALQCLAPPGRAAGFPTFWGPTPGHVAHRRRRLDVPALPAAPGGQPAGQAPRRPGAGAARRGRRRAERRPGRRHHGRHVTRAERRSLQTVRADGADGAKWRDAVEDYPSRACDRPYRGEPAGLLADDGGARLKSLLHLPLTGRSRPSGRMRLRGGSMSSSGASAGTDAQAGGRRPRRPRGRHRRPLRRFTHALRPRGQLLAGPVVRRVRPRLADARPSPPPRRAGGCCIEEQRFPLSELRQATRDVRDQIEVAGRGSAHARPGARRRLSTSSSRSSSATPTRCFGEPPSLKRRPAPHSPGCLTGVTASSTRTL